MENNNILDLDLSDELHLNEAVKTNLKKAFKWGKVLAIMLFIFFGFMVLFYFKLLTAETRQGGSSVQTLITIILLTFTVCLFFSAFNLLGFVNRGMISLDTNNNKVFSICIESLTGYFKFYGIFLSIITVFFVIGFLSIMAVYFN
ncbi:MAG: hypothetical protein AB8H03_20215 [Saprospiraceae bacterium]